MQIVLASDSLKGTLSTDDTAELLRSAAARHLPDATCVAVPMADGGEGTAEVLARACGGTMLSADAHDALGRPVTARYALLPHGEAVIEMAAAAGLPLLANRERDPELASTYGVGELVLDALDHGATSLTLALGGSATNDGGAGCMRALGFGLLDASGRKLAGRGCDLARLARIDASHADARLARLRVTVMCDVDAPLLGPDGATMVFGPQKGADAAALGRLEAGMANYARVLEATFGQSFDVPGAGAAGGMGAGCLAFLGARQQSGITRVLELVRFGELLGHTDLVVTGEGRLDAQTERGKVVAGVAAACARAHVPCVAVVGAIAPGARLPQGLAAAFPTASGPIALDYALSHARELYADAADRLFCTIALGRSLGGVRTAPNC